MRSSRSNKSPKSMLNLWERLEIKYNHEGDTASFVTRIEDFDKQLLVVEKPVRIAGGIDLNVGNRIEVSFNRDDTAYTFEALIVSIDNKREDIFTLKTISELKRSQRRRFVRIDIAGEVSFKIIDMSNESQPEISLDKKGELLNISAGGILLNTGANLRKGDLVLLNFWLKNSQRLENVLGMVKRHEQEGEDDSGRIEYLTGIEFLTKEKISNKYSHDLMQSLPSKVTFFDEALQQAIVQFVYRQQVEHRHKTKVKS